MKMHRMVAVSGILCAGASLAFVTAQAGVTPGAEARKAPLVWERCSSEGFCVSSATPRHCIEFWGTLANGRAVTACVDYPLD